MTKRRSLADGLKSSLKGDPKKEAEFVYHPKKAKSAVRKTEESQPAEKPSAASTPEPQAELPVEKAVGRSPLTTRLRADIGAALKRASLERQLSGQEPSAVQDILDTALEPWLKANGYLK